MTDIILDKDNKPVFVGKEDPNNPPVKPPSGSQMQCEKCGGMFDYLLGSVKLMCEGCYDPSLDKPDKKGDFYDKSKEIL